MSAIDGAIYNNITSSTLIRTGTGKVHGFIINSNTSGTLKLWDNTSGAGTVIMNTYTFPAGSSVVTFPKSINFYTGLYATIGGTADITIIWNHQ